MTSGEKRADWSSVYRSKRPRDILDLTEEHETTLRQFFGLTGRDQEGNLSQIFIIKYEGVVEPVLTDYPNLPVSTIIICPKLSTPKIFIRKIKSIPVSINVVGNIVLSNTAGQISLVGAQSVDVNNIKA